MFFDVSFVLLLLFVGYTFPGKVPGAYYVHMDKKYSFPGITSVTFKHKILKVNAL